MHNLCMMLCVDAAGVAGCVHVCVFVWEERGRALDGVHVALRSEIAW